MTSRESLKELGCEARLHSEFNDLCVECSENVAQGVCDTCNDAFCSSCFHFQHKYGNRSKHTLVNVKHPEMKISPTLNVLDAMKAEFDDDSFESHSLWIPMLLTHEERIMMHLLYSALNVSNYTANVDIIDPSNVRRVAIQAKEISAIFSGILTAVDYSEGQKALKCGDFKTKKHFFQTIIEISRRYKIINPEKVFNNFCKLIYILQDVKMPYLDEILAFDCIKSISTVHGLLSSKNALAVLHDPHIEMATREIVPQNKTRDQVRQEILKKKNAQNYLASKYCSNLISKDEIRSCLYSINDNRSFLSANCTPCEKMINYLKQYFDPEYSDDLCIQMGCNGSRLSHSHRRQFHYVLQSLMLWKEILSNMYRLWMLAERDLLDSSNTYSLQDTGQGYHRIQASPRLSNAIHKILFKVQSQVQGHWVGSSVIHLGDHNVPNALFFLVKYLAVSSILNPIVLCLEKMETLKNDRNIHVYLDSKGGVETVKKDILKDFFTHAFDGSGADNFFNAGSCIDGRLTSTWNWCNKIETKPYFPVFLLTGFFGFQNAS